MRAATPKRVGGEQRVRWLTTIPRHWGIVPSKWLFAHRKQRALAGDQQLTASQEDGVIPQAEFIRRAGRQVMQVLLNREILKHVEKDDFVISMRSFQGGLERSWASGCISSAYVVLEQKGEAYAPFFAHLFKSTAYIQALQATSNLVRDGQALRYDNFCMVHLPRLPIGQQKAIADFLDRKTAAIDALIEKKQKLLDLLAEKRTALINQAVTKGLDRNVPMKDSGIPWIGEIPAHWTWTRAKFLTSTISDCLHSTPDYLDEGFPALRTADVRPGWLDLEHARRVDEATLNERNQRLWPREGDVIYTREGGRFGVAAPVPHGVRLCLAQRVMLLRPSPKTDPQYLMWVLNSKSVFEQAVVETIGAASPRVNMETVANYVVPKPPREEQVAIATHLTEETATIASQADLLVGSQAKLMEYRQALITAAVTGQLEIPEKAA